MSLGLVHYAKICEYTEAIQSSSYLCMYILFSWEGMRLVPYHKPYHHINLQQCHSLPVMIVAVHF